MQRIGYSAVVVIVIAVVAGCAVEQAVDVVAEEAAIRDRSMQWNQAVIDGDIDAVMSAILGFALDLCEAEFGILFEHHGDRRYAASHTRGIPKPFRHWLDAHGTFVASQHTGLDCGTNGDRLVRVDVLARLLAKEILHRLLYFRHTRLATDEDNVVNFVDLEARVLECHTARLDRARNQFVDQRFEEQGHGKSTRAPWNTATANSQATAVWPTMLNHIHFRPKISRFSSQFEQAITKIIKPEKLKKDK